MITARRLRLLRARDLAGYRSALTNIARTLDSQLSASAFVLVPTSAAAAQLTHVSIGQLTGSLPSAGQSILDGSVTIGGTIGGSGSFTANGPVTLSGTPKTLTGSKTLTQDKCGPAPDSGHGHVVEYPQAKIKRLTEEHGQVDAVTFDKPPKVGERVTIIPNHICPCINLHDRVWWRENGEPPRPIPVDARGRVH